MALPAWISKISGNNEGEYKFELPKVIQDQLDEAKGLKTQVETMSTKLGALDDITAYIREQREAAAKPKPKPVPSAEESEDERRELAGLLLTDPEAAYARLAGKTNAAVMMVRADNVRRETFEDNAEKFPYYTGEVKLEINKILAKQSLEFRNSPEALENTYYTVVGKMQKEISEGKIKDRFASSTSSRGSGNLNEVDDRKKITVNDDITKIASQLGMKVDDYVKLLEEDVERYV
jgi:hypothetical protein